MDATQAQQKVDTLTAQVATDQQTLANDEAALKQAQDELAAVSLVNSIEALTPDSLAAVNNALASDNSNYRVQDITPVPEPDQPAA